MVLVGSKWVPKLPKLSWEFHEIIISTIIDEELSSNYSLRSVQGLGKIPTKNKNYSVFPIKWLSGRDLKGNGCVTQNTT